MEFRILGPLEAWQAAQLISLGGPKQRALLAVLLMQANRVVPASRLIELIWGKDAPETAGATLQVTISNLRKILEPDHPRGAAFDVLVSLPAGYMLRLSADQLDSTCFERLAAAGRQALVDGNALVAADTLREALTLWRGAALADFSDEPFAVAESTRLNEMMLQALESRIEADLALRRHAELVGELESLMVKYPLRERLCGQLMLALYRCGRQAEASDLYYKTRDALVEQQGMDPGSDLQSLFKAILNHDPSLDLPTQKAIVRRPRSTNLPHQLSSFIGRAEPVNHVKLLLSQSRLVTLAGSGGVGKTRLALEVGRSLLSDYEDGIWLVELAPIADQALVPLTVATTLGLRDAGGRPIIEALTDYLNDRQLLLIVDNCEHLVEGCARLVRTLLQACPTLRVLATSREALAIGGELAWRVPSLSTPDASQPHLLEDAQRYEAVALFVDRAAQIRDFHLTESNKQSILLLCQQLDGIPLALELAAARLAVLSLDQIVSRLGDRFRLLTGGDRGNLPRQQTLQATIDWSYDLLPTGERTLLRRLAVFVGGTSLDGCESVCAGDGIASADVLGLLGGLVRKSLVLMYESPTGMRYRLIETIRQYARARLVESDERRELEKRHQRWFLGLARDAETGLIGPDQLHSLEVLDAERDNLRAALEWSMTQESPDDCLVLVGALSRFWRFRGYLTEGRQWLDRALSRSTADSAGRAWALAWGSWLAQDQSDFASGVPLGEQSLSMFRRIGDRAGIAFALQVLGNAGAIQDDYEGATRALEQSVKLLSDLGDRHALSHSLFILGHIAISTASYERALDLNNQALELAREVGDKRQIGVSLRALAEVCVYQENYVSAALLADEALHFFQQLRDERMTAFTLYYLGVIARCQLDYARASAFQDESSSICSRLGARAEAAYAQRELATISLDQGNTVKAHSLIRQSLKVSHEVNDRWGLAKGLEVLAAVACDTHDFRRAALLFGTAMALRTEIGAPVESFERAAYDRRLKGVRKALGAGEADRYLEEGRRLTPVNRLALALELGTVQDSRLAPSVPVIT